MFNNYIASDDFKKLVPYHVIFSWEAQFSLWTCVRERGPFVDVLQQIFAVWIGSTSVYLQVSFFQHNVKMS